MSAWAITDRFESNVDDLLRVTAKPNRRLVQNWQNLERGFDTHIYMHSVWRTFDNESNSASDALWPLAGPTMSSNESCSFSICHLNNIFTTCWHTFLSLGSADEQESMSVWAITDRLESNVGVLFTSRIKLGFLIKVAQNLRSKQFNFQAWIISGSSIPYIRAASSSRSIWWKL